MTSEEDTRSQAEEFTKQAEMAPTSFLGDIFYFLRNNRKWWMLPLIILLLGFGLLMILATTGAAPLIYTLF
jgi:hypothetical protein